MKNVLLNILRSACFVLPSAVLMNSCIDATIDYEDIDAKVQLNVDGLKVRFGNTERIQLRDMLKPEGNIKVDKNQLYYLVEEGSTSFDFSVAPVSTEVDANRMSVKTDLGKYVWDIVMTQLPAYQKAEYKKQFPQYPAETIDAMVDKYVQEIKSGQRSVTVTPAMYGGGDYADFADEKDFELNIDWDDAVTEISAVDLKDLVFSLEIHLNDESTTANPDFNPSKNFLIKGLKDVVVTLPSYIKAKNMVDGRIRIKDQINEHGATSIRLENVTVDALAFKQALRKGQSPKEKFRISGKISMGIQRAFTVKGAPSGHISLVVKVNGKERDKVEAVSVKGKFNPTIEPTINPINVKEELPDFLVGDEVQLRVNDITLRLDADLTQIPASILLKNGQLIAQRGNTTTPIHIAPEGLTLDRGKKNTLYFYQGKQPWDIAPVAADAKRSHVANFNQLVEQLPDQVQVKLGAGTIKLGEETTTIEFGKNYTAAMDYKLFVPFSFNAGMTINYTEMSDEIDLDTNEISLTDNQVEVTADVISTIPLDLEATAHPLDQKGDALSGVAVSIGKIKAAVDNQPTTTPLRLTLTTNNPHLLRELHHIKFAVKASAGADIQSAHLRSDQYLQIRDARIKLSGKVVADFN